MTDGDEFVIFLEVLFDDRTKAKENALLITEKICLSIAQPSSCRHV